MISNGSRKPDLPLRLLFSFSRMILSSPPGKLILGKIYHALTPPKNGWLEVNQIPLTLPRLHTAFDGYRLAQLTDFHIGTWATRPQIEEAILRINDLQPDMVVITGDFVTYTPENYAEDLTGALQLLDPPDGTYAILGNHDHWSNPVLVRQVLEQVGITDLSNATRTIYRDQASLTIAGIDDYMEELDDLDQVLKQLPEEGSAILLAHEPDFADISAKTGQFDLQLSGHTHGGQVQLPKIGAVILPKYGKKYPSGLYRVDQMYLYTNRGVGTAELKMRYNCPAEVALFILNSSDRDHEIADKS